MLDIDVQRENTLNALTYGSDLKGDIDVAKIFLNDVMRATPPALYGLTIPVARRLMSFEGWDRKITVNMVVDYCCPHYQPLVLLKDTYGQSANLDPEAEYMSGMACSLAFMAGLIT